MWKEISIALEVATYRVVRSRVATSIVTPYGVATT
jgi:hypothetical protein